MSEIKSCPFCGGTETRVAGNEIDFTWVVCTWVVCTSCRAEGPVKPSANESIAAWNQRADGWVSSVPKH